MAIKIGNILFNIEECESVIDALKGLYNNVEITNKEIEDILNETTHKLQEYKTKKENELKDM